MIEKEFFLGIRERAAKRKTRIVAYRAQSFQDAEAWDLAFWQAQTPQQRLSALVAIRRDIAKVPPGKTGYEVSMVGLKPTGSASTT
ncbi:MAG: hypothetical protein WAK95_17995 [Desulfobacterales bacterium]